MNKTTKRILFVCAGAALLLASCYSSQKTILAAIYGIREPRTENAQTMVAASKKYEMDTTNIVTVTPEGYRDLFALLGHGVPDVLIFDKQGNYLEYRANDSSCNAGVYGFIPALQKGGRYKMTGKTRMSAALASLRNMDGNALPVTFLDNSADFYVFISWVAFVGKLNQDHVSKWERLAARNTNARIRTIAVNFDTQQWWPAAAQDSMLKKYAGL